MNIDIKYEIANRRAGDLPKYFAKTKKANDLLKWQAKKSIHDMCSDSLKWQNKLNEI